VGKKLSKKKIEIGNGTFSRSETKEINFLLHLYEISNPVSLPEISSSGS
jgi:hypothetical protein